MCNGSGLKVGQTSTPKRARQPAMPPPWQPYLGWHRQLVVGVAKQQEGVKWTSQLSTPSCPYGTVLTDLDRYGLIATYWDAKRRAIIHATEKADLLFKSEDD